MSANPSLVAGIELGGTKCVCIVGSGPDDVREMRTVVTRQPAATLTDIEDCIADMLAAHGPVVALGIASFGPIDLDPSSGTYGFVTSTPKPGWRHTNVAVRLRDRFCLPMRVDTDVNAAALAEGLWGRARGLADFAYVTVGTGIGVGLVSGGRSIRGLAHPEAGHLRLARHSGDHWSGHCPFHGDCVEGLASGPAIEARAGKSAAELAADDPVWEIVAHTLGQLCASLTLTTAPARILFGGGVINAQPHLFPRIRRHFAQSLAGYVETPAIMARLDEFICAAGLGDRAGPLGALALGHAAVSAG